MRINLRVWLKIPDAEAATVKNTLLRRLGYQGILGDVKRERLFCIDVDGSADARELARQITRELVNENKESSLVTFDSLDFDPEYVPVRVALRIEDGEAISVKNRLVHRLGLSAVRRVERANIWKLYLDCPDKEGVAREIAERLLINPNKDRYEIL
ncbi:MAG: phosphoribosylformylglycinamidine synthase [Methanosaeta sp. PtaB.Bin039]|nr:MAG: phosphoribosylformylglycinamidine synthase [Methanosaeta sp. PtaB.Bin039]OPY45228.1 MAG: phosphoribosylformylglycinamidine synthase [Methanosaeta sp. PtaU1.Bin028]HQF16605.1 phosphoribosylformylglycinamidine synthase subunit PurS [Methanotrichaceae archaeon]HQI91237.1 phosphoribosylformylglycinamidine synthase subunit PurS [Methanotrichaceae archaeon]HQJ61715.1 phosphoribosylformylglycinamidine synthase subunit PurS [Methanothrix soehngenii]